MSPGAEPAKILPVASGLDEATSNLCEALARHAEQRLLRRGEVLVREGDPSDALHFVLSGRFAVYLDGVRERVAEVGHGEPIGEVGFFAGLPRTATAIALRDSTVLTITRDRFHDIGRSSPAIQDAVILSLARRLARTGRPSSDVRTTARTLAVLPAGGSALSPKFVDVLRSVFGARSRTVFLTEREVVDKRAGAPLDSPELSWWLNSLEAEAGFVLYIADETLTAWTEKCIRQADTVLLVAQAGASVDLNPSELLALSLHARSARRLVVVREARTQITSGTSSWLREREVFLHHHVALQDGADVERLYRFVSGTAVGFVAGSGGALGSAHLGVYKAFCEAGANFDMLGGTSVGAAMAAALACGADPERVDRGTHNIFVTSRAFRRPTVPRYGLIDHKAFDRALWGEFGDALIEDLWTPFFAVSSNLSTHEATVHRRGLVWHSVRASASIPGVLPPFFTKEGEMLVDGALMHHVPLEPMKQLKAGPNLIVVLGLDDRRTYAVDYSSIPGPLELTAAMLNPFARRQLPQVPGILQVIMLSMFANRRLDLAVSDTDLLIRPGLPPGVGFTSWAQHNEVFMGVYRDTASWIRARSTELDSALLAVLGAAADLTPAIGTGFWE
jgi:NTE family protein